MADHKFEITIAGQEHLLRRTQSSDTVGFSLGAPRGYTQDHHAGILPFPFTLKFNRRPYIYENRMRIVLFNTSGESLFKHF